MDSPSLRCQLLCNSDRSGVARRGDKSPEYRMILSPESGISLGKQHTCPVCSTRGRSSLSPINTELEAQTWDNMHTAPDSQECPNVPHGLCLTHCILCTALTMAVHVSTPQPTGAMNMPAAACIRFQNTRHVCRELSSR